MGALQRRRVNARRFFLSVAGLTPDARHKPEAPDAGPSGTGGGSKSLTADLAMSLEEAHLILNVKKEDKMETILDVSCV